MNKETKINKELPVKEYMQSLGVRARAASQLIANADGQTKNKALNAIATALLDSQAELVSENQKDMQACLLYTSPSPRDKRQSRMPSSA